MIKHFVLTLIVITSLVFIHVYLFLFVISTVASKLITRAIQHSYL